MYIDSQAQDRVAELQKLGGAKVFLATATSGEAMSAVQGGLAANDTLMVIGATDSMQVSPLFLIGRRRSIKGCIPELPATRKTRSHLVHAQVCIR